MRAHVHAHEHGHTRVHVHAPPRRPGPTAWEAATRRQPVVNDVLLTRRRVVAAGWL